MFRGGLSEISRLAEPGRRAEAMSAFFGAAYLGLGLPVVLIGLLTELISTVAASAWVAGRLAVLIVAVSVIVARARLAFLAHTGGNGPAHAVRPVPGSRLAGQTACRPTSVNAARAWLICSAVGGATPAQG